MRVVKRIGGIRHTRLLLLDGTGDPSLRGRAHSIEERLAIVEMTVRGIRCDAGPAGRLPERHRGRAARPRKIQARVDERSAQVSVPVSFPTGS